MKKKVSILILFFYISCTSVFSKNNLYEKIDLFGEVLENIQKDYVDDVDQSDMMDSAINGVLQSLDPYSAYMSPELFKEMQTDTRGEFGGLGIEIGMEAGVVKVIAPIDDTPAAKAGIKAGDYNLVVAGGVESMSRAPFVMPKAEAAFSRTNAVYDTTIGWRFVNPKMVEAYGTDSMPETADNVAEDYGINRAD